MPDRLPRPWHGASDREDDAGVQALRLQRAEVDALFAFRGANEDSGEAIGLWRRLSSLREQRCAVMEPGAASKLPPLPEAPPGIRAGVARTNSGGWRKLLGFLGRGREGRPRAPF